MKLPENALLKEALLKHSTSVHQYCKEMKFTYELVMKLIQLRDPIWLKGREKEYRSLCKRLAAALCIPVEQLFPPEIYSADYYANQVRKTLADEASEDRKKLPQIHNNSPEQIYAAKEAAKSVLADLSARETRLLLLYTVGKDTLKDIGESEGISIERTRQIIKRAAQKVLRARKRNKL